MKSIPYRAWIVQGSRMSMNKNGLAMSCKGLQVRGKHLDGVKRGVIRGWSRSSVRRLRETLFFKDVPNSNVYGVTLTLPWKDGAFDVATMGEEFRQILERFRTNFLVSFAHSSMVYRIELQTRKAPHIHAVVFVSPDDVKSNCTLKEWLLINWCLKAVKDLHGGSALDFCKHGIDVKQMDATNRNYLFRYLVDHASKRKQAQLGWKGRQWGVVGSKNLQSLPNEFIEDLSPRAEVLFWRMVRRLNAYHPKAKCIFGQKVKLSTRRFGVSFFNGGGSSLRRILDYVKSVYPKQEINPQI